MARELRVPRILLWTVFLAALAAGASLLLSPVQRLQLLGLAILFVPIVAFGAMMALYYLRSRRLALAEARQP